MLWWLEPLAFQFPENTTTWLNLVVRCLWRPRTWISLKMEQVPAEEFVVHDFAVLLLRVLGYEIRWTLNSGKTWSFSCMARTGVLHSKVFLFVQEDRLWKIQKPNSSAAFSANNQPRVLVLDLPQQFLEVIVLVSLWNSWQPRQWRGSRDGDTFPLFQDLNTAGRRSQALFCDAKGVQAIYELPLGWSSKHRTKIFSTVFLWADTMAFET